MREVLMVAEKPNLAQTLANFLSNNNVRRMCIDKCLKKGLPLYEWEGPWPLTGEVVHYKMTSTYGHVNEIQFEPEFEDWRKDPEELFSCGVFKRERDPESKVVQQLTTVGRRVDFLVLWLDCDKEGENICFEVMECVVPVMKMSHNNAQNVFRAQFSALTDRDVHDAFYSLRYPNEHEARSVDARMELDLRIGCAFTRFQTRYFVRKYGKETLQTNTVPFGPCQTPTLAFCVNRHQQIEGFTGEPFWKVQAEVKIPGGQLPIPLEWRKKRTFDRNEAYNALHKLETRRHAVVRNITAEEKRKLRPPALNTVQLLRLASSYLKMSPNETMEHAERLYMEGFISYPRTETTQYPNSFDRTTTLSKIVGNGQLGKVAERLMYFMPDSQRFGKDAGDHPPIIPLKCPNSRLTQNKRAHDLYQMICENFLAGLSSDCIYQEKTVTYEVDGEHFHMEGVTVVENGFTDILKYQRMRCRQIPNIQIGTVVPVGRCSVKEEVTKPPEHLTESDLIDLMEQHGIGTDASIPVHIQNIFKRNFVQLTPERRIVPTPVGIAIIQAYNALDDDLAKPQIRSTLERDLVLIAEGKEPKEAIVSHVLAIYREKYRYLAQNVAIMDTALSSVLHLNQPAATSYIDHRASGSVTHQQYPPARAHITKRPPTENREPFHAKKPKYNQSSSFGDSYANNALANLAPAPAPPVRLPENCSVTDRLLALATVQTIPVANSSRGPGRLSAPLKRTMDENSKSFSPPKRVCQRPEEQFSSNFSNQTSFMTGNLGFPIANRGFMSENPRFPTGNLRFTAGSRGVPTGNPRLPTGTPPQRFNSNNSNLFNIPVQFINPIPAVAQNVSAIRSPNPPQFIKQEPISVFPDPPRVSRFDSPQVKQEPESSFHPALMIPSTCKLGIPVANVEGQMQVQLAPSAGPVNSSPFLLPDPGGPARVASTSVTLAVRQNQWIKEGNVHDCVGNAPAPVMSHSIPPTANYSLAGNPLLNGFSTLGKDPVQAVYELCSKAKFGSPVFNCIQQLGPSHCPEFIYQLHVNGIVYGPVSAQNKKEAMKGISKLVLLGLGFPMDCGTEPCF